MQPALGYVLAALFFFAAFWAFASASDWFVDAPFLYTTHDEWSQNLTKSLARCLRQEEAALFVASIFGVLPAVLFVALLLRERAAWPLRALERLAARDSLRFTALFAGIAMGLAWLGFQFVLRGTALIDDERSYLFAARNMVSGSFFRDAVPAAFRNPMLLTTPAWISKYPPGFAAILTPGVLLGLPRLMPSIVCGLSVVGMFQLAKSLFGLRTAVVASAFWALSPFQLAIHSTTMIFGTSGCLALWTGALLARSLTRNDERALIGAALLSFVHVLVRPFDAALVLATLGLAIAAFGPRPTALRRTAIFGSGFVMGTIAFAAFNRHVFGTALSSGYTVAKDYKFGFFVHSLPGFSYVHTPVQALAHVVVAFARLDSWLVGVPGALALAMLTLVKPNRSEQALLLAVAVHLIGYSLMASSGTFDVGPTYYYLVAPCYLLLAIRGGLRVKLTLARKYRNVVTWASIAVLPVAWLTVVPMRAIRLKELTTAINAPWEFLATSNLSRGLVIVPPFRTMRAAGYALGYPYDVATKTGTLQLIRPKTLAELADAARSLRYSGPVYRLEFDEQAFESDGSRRYALREFAQLSDVNWPTRTLP
jgi:Dolichyl-phosphate-mannose-protein mannosyltransferase